MLDQTAGEEVEEEHVRVVHTEQLLTDVEAVLALKGPTKQLPLEFSHHT